MKAVLCSESYTGGTTTAVPSFLSAPVLKTESYWGNPSVERGESDTWDKIDDSAIADSPA